MPLAKDLIGPFPVGQARALGGGVNSSVTAAGSSQSTATDLTASVNVVTTATVGQGVQLPAMDIGDECEVLNLGSGAIVVYPASGERINNISADSGFVLAQYTAVKVKKFTSNRCVAFLSA